MDKQTAAKPAAVPAHTTASPAHTGGQPRKNNLTDIRHEIQRIQLILIIITTIFMSVGGAVINVNASDKAFDQNLQETAGLITRIYGFMREAPRRDLCIAMDGIAAELADVDVISIVDTQNIRIYHTNHNLIGTEYDGTHPDFSTHKKGFYTESDIGPSGPQRRSYSAVYDENGNYIGFIMAIMLKTSIRSFTYKIVLLFVIVTLAAIIIEIAICRAFSRKLKRRLLGYEPDTFTSMYRIRENILESTYDGIIAVDSDNNIQFSNKAAKKMLGCTAPDCEDTTAASDEKISQIKQTVFAEKYLSQVISSGAAEFGIQTETENGTALLIDCIPVTEDGVINGAVALLHDRTEYTKLMEELAGTKYLVDSMRANNHDFTNKLHVILGLIQIGEYDKAVSYIENISIIQRETLSTVMHAVDNASFAALLIGKIARASECNVRFILKEGIRFKSSEAAVPSEALVTIAGNLIDNALDAMNMNLNNDRQRELEFGVFTKPGELLITVRDTGCGIPPEIGDRIFEKGFSTKGTGRGVGMYHTKQLVESLGGTISFESEKDIGTSFMVLLKGSYV